MTSQPQSSKSDQINTSETKEVLAPAFREQLSPVTQSLRKGRWLVTQVYVFLVQLIEGTGRFFNEYKQLFITVALFLAAIITLRIVLAIMNALNDIPLVQSTLELIGVGYSVWFVSRYLLTPSKRQELSQTIQQFFNEQG